MAKYTVLDNQTGKTVTFVWEGKDPPGDDDLEEVFSQARAMAPQQSYLGKTASNIIPSAVRVGEDVIGAITSPIETAKNIGRTAMGGLQKLVGTDQPQEYEDEFGRVTVSPGLSPEQDYRPYAEAVGKHFAGRYGGLENIKRTFSEDPAGVALDASTLLTGGGTAAARAGLQAGKGVARVAGMVDPINIAKGGMSLAAKAVPESFLYKMYQSSTKWKTSLTAEERATLTSTAFKENILPSVKGVEKAGSIIEDLKAQVNQIVDSADEIANLRSGTMGPNPYLKNINELFDQFPELINKTLATAGEPMKDLRAIKRIKNEILQANEMLGRQMLTPRQAQNLKVKLHQELDGFYDKIMNRPIAGEAKAKVATEARSFLEGLAPELKLINAREGSLIELKKAIEKSANRITNRDLIGIGVPIKTITGTVADGTFGGAGGLVLGILDTPAVKARLAMTLKNLKRDGVQVKSLPTLMRLGLIESEKIYGEPYP